MNTDIIVSSRQARAFAFNPARATPLPPEHMLPAILSGRELKKIVADLLG